MDVGVWVLLYGGMLLLLLSDDLGPEVFAAADVEALVIDVPAERRRGVGVVFVVAFGMAALADALAVHGSLLEDLPQADCGCGAGGHDAVSFSFSWRRTAARSSWTVGGSLVKLSHAGRWQTWQGFAAPGVKLGAW
jgi:hypothetical protein